MNTDSFETFKVNAQDITCPVCYERYSTEKNQPMVLACGHSVCSSCEPKIKSCPHCRKAFLQKPAKNILASSFIENDSQARKCTIHGKPKDYLSKAKKKWLCSDCIILEEHKKEYNSREEVELKVKETKEEQKAIRKKKAEIQLKIPQLLNKRSRDLEAHVDNVFQSKLESLFWRKKKMKSIIQICTFTDKDCYEHQLIAEDLLKFEQKIEGMLEKWGQKNQEEDLTAQIFEAPFEIKSYLESFAKKEKRMTNDFTEEEKRLKKLISESTLNFSLKKFADAKSKLNPECLPEIYQGFLLRTFQDYGIQYEHKDEEIHLQENFSHLYRFSPHLFNCSLEKLNLTCAANLSDQKFKILCNILSSIQNLSNLSINFEAFSLKKAELLSKLILNSKTLKKFSSRTPLLEGLGDSLVQLFQSLSPGKFSNININSTANNVLLEIQLDHSQKAGNSLEQLNLKLEFNFSNENLLTPKVLNVSISLPLYI